MKRIKIIEEANVIDDHLLDIIGNEFNFNHEKGLAEWIKNSADAYIREAIPDNEQNVILRFTDNEFGSALIECIDFVGMTEDDIRNAFKRWGDPEAAKRGIKKKVYGGHGNGGKFYMRQMFNESYFITYKNRKLNVYGFSTNKKYGFADGKKEINYSLEEALEFAEIKDIVPAGAMKKMINDEVGFTVVRGIAPHQMPKKIKVKHICEKITHHPQARRVLMRIPVMIIHNSKIFTERLTPPKIEPYAGFEEPIILEIPETLILNKDGENIPVKTTNQKYTNNGQLTLRTSEIALVGSSKFGDLNRVDILSELGSIGSYRILELGVKNSIQSTFIFGECYCPILEDENNCLVRNDREKLIENDLSNALLEWIAEKIDELANQILEKEKKEHEEIQKKLSSRYNDFLNKWKNKYMNKLYAQIFGGSGTGSGVGSGSGGSGPSDGKGGSESKHRGSGDGGKGGGNEEQKKGRKFPEVKLSSWDMDPLNPESTIHLDPRQPVIYQRPQDVSEGIYWINTSSPLAKAIIYKYGSEHPRWRDFLFQRYLDIFVKEGLDLLSKKDPENFNVVGVDRTIDEIISSIHSEASKDLEKFLFDEFYEPIA